MSHAERPSPLRGEGKTLRELIAAHPEARDFGPGQAWDLTRRCFTVAAHAGNPASVRYLDAIRRWMAARESLRLLEEALAVGVTETELVTHLDGTRRLDLGAVRTVAALLSDNPA